MTQDDSIMQELYTNWCIAAYHADNAYDELDEDITHPLYIEADRQARKELMLFLHHQTASPRYILLKLQVACDMEDYLTDSMNPQCLDIAPHAVVAAMHDLNCMVDI